MGWMIYELDYDRREAQAEADLAYRMWCQLPGRDGYAVYRAAQDRADAAQDALASWVRGTRMSGPAPTCLLEQDAASTRR